MQRRSPGRGVIDELGQGRAVEALTRDDVGEDANGATVSISFRFQDGLRGHTLSSVQGVRGRLFIRFYIMGSLKIDHSIFGTCYGFTTSGVGLRSRNLVRDSPPTSLRWSATIFWPMMILIWTGTRRRPENRLGLALHIALLRHPGPRLARRHRTARSPGRLARRADRGALSISGSLRLQGGQRAPTTGGWPSGISACVRSCLRTTCEQRWTWLPGRRSTPTTGASFWPA